MKKKKSIVFLVILVLMGIVGTTYAYFTQSASFDNNFSIKDFDVVIEEDFDKDSYFGCTQKYSEETDSYVEECISEVNKDVFVVNKEDVPAIVRISYNEEFIDSELPINIYRDLTSIALNPCSVNEECTYHYRYEKVWTKDFLDN